MNRLIAAFCSGALAFGFSTTALHAEDVAAAAPPSAQFAKEKKPLIQMAILLDNSGSMQGLIDQARSQLWKIVNEFALAKRNGQRPELQVALYEYGEKPMLLQPFTTDLDKISDLLFKLTIRGGDEFCGEVIGNAVEKLNWSASNDDLKVIFIAGNEPFTQGPVDFHKSCSAAIAKGIIVNTIHCGSEAEGVQGQWRDGALLADGKFMNIDQNQRVASIEAPQDAEIAKLGVELNKTYIAYGKQADESKKQQAEQDKNAEKAMQGASVQRAICKASGNYQNGQWDLVDAQREQQVKLEDMKVEDLPDEMQKLKPEERAAYVETKGKERAGIQEKINKLNEARTQFVADEMKKRAAAGENTLDSAVISTVREQCVKKNYELNK